MHISKINGTLVSPFEFYTEEAGEKFYIANFEIEDGLTVPVVVSEYIKADSKQKQLLTGHLCTTNKRPGTHGRQHLFTFFRIRKMENVNPDDKGVAKQINVKGKIINTKPLQVSNNGIEYFTLIAKEYYDGIKTSIIHYTASGALARKLSATVHVGDTVTGRGMLHARGKTLEVVLEDLRINKKGGNEDERKAD